MKKGLLIILSGPSGVGKGAVRRYVFSNEHLDLYFSISMTTRKIRPEEVDGVDYYFVDHETFEKNIKEGNLLEYTNFVGNYYGTPKDKVESIRKQGKDVFLEIEMNGANKVMSCYPDDHKVISFFLMPPSVKDLEERIRKRGTESEEVIAERLSKGIKEMKDTKMYDYVILNDTVSRAGEEIISIIKKAHKKR